MGGLCNLTHARISVISFLAHLISLYLLIKSQLKHYLIQKDSCTLLPHPVLVYGPLTTVHSALFAHPIVSYLSICLSLTRARLAECILFFLWFSSPLGLGNPIERGVWLAPIHEVTRVGRDLVTESPPAPYTVSIPQAFSHYLLNDWMGSPEKGGRAFPMEPSNVKVWNGETF